MLLCGELSRGGDGGGVPVYTHTCMYIFTYIYMHIIVHIYIHKYTHTCTHTYTATNNRRNWVRRSGHGRIIKSDRVGQAGEFLH